MGQLMNLVRTGPTKLVCMGSKTSDESAVMGDLTTFYNVVQVGKTAAIRHVKQTKYPFSWFDNVMP